MAWTGMACRPARKAIMPGMFDGKAHGQAARVAALSDPKRIPVGQLGDLSLVEWLRRFTIRPMVCSSFIRLISISRMIGDADNAARRGVVGTWYARNLRIFGNILGLVEETARAGVGASMARAAVYPLRQMARESGAFRVEDASAYLSKCTRFPLRLFRKRVS